MLLLTGCVAGTASGTDTTDPMIEPATEPVTEPNPFKPISLAKGDVLTAESLAQFRIVYSGGCADRIAAESVKKALQSCYVV